MTEEIKVTKTLDVCGEICPYPDVNTMATLKKMEKGEILEVLLDSGLIKTRNEGQRLIREGAVYLEGKKITDENANLKLKPAIIKLGSRRFLKLLVSK